MQLTAIWALLLATLAPMIADVQSRVSNDRIVFPGDTAKVNSGLDIATRSGTSGANESTEMPAVSDRVVFPEDKDYPKSDSYNMGSSNSTLRPSNSTSSSIVGPQPESFENTTVVVNRILLETLKVCPKGHSLHVGYCRRKV